MFKVGAAKSDVTYFKKGLVMLGYGRPFHKMKGIETRLYARSVVIESGQQRLCFVNVEMGFCTVYLKYGVIQKLKNEFPQLGLHDGNVMITAQHTHSGAGGYGQHFTYNIPSPGFQKEVWEHIKNGIVQSIVMAHLKVKEANLKMGFGIFDEKEEVAFNRSLEAHNLNPEIKKKLKKEEWHLACDRDMKLMQFEDNNGKVIASINWFGTHCTSVSNDKYNICSDNKGYASTFFEKYYQELNQDDTTICIFAQDASGDVSPNYVWDIRKQWTRGKYKDDYESAKYTGNLQYEKAKKITSDLKKKNVNRLESYQSYIEFSDINCDPDFTNGKKGCRTSGASLGISFFEGTVEGPGMLKPIGSILKSAMDIHKKNELKWLKDEKRTQKYKDYIRLKHETQSPKRIGIEASKGKFVWLDQEAKIPIPGIFEKTISNAKNAIEQRKSVHKPWIATRLPLQFFILGNIAIVGIPFELTTMSGRRIRKMLKAELASYDIDQVILSPFANAYAGYITTQEEYMIQMYEGGHTLFGKWTLPALQTALRRTIEKLKKGEEDKSKPLIFTEDQIWVYQ